MKYSFVTAILSCVVIGSAQAATLMPERGVSVLYINGQVSESKIGENQLNEGFNQIVVRMDKNLSRSSSSDVFTSKPYAISFSFSGEHVVINHPEVHSSMDAKKLFAKQDPKWEVLVDGSPIDYEQTEIKGKNGFLPFSGLGEIITEHNKANGIYFKDGVLIDKPAEAIMAASSVPVVSSTVAKDSTTKVSNEIVQQPQAVEQLQAWYIKASKQERKAFRRWMIDQE